MVRRTEFIPFKLTTRRVYQAVATGTRNEFRSTICRALLIAAHLRQLAKVLDCLGQFRCLAAGLPTAAVALGEQLQLREILGCLKPAPCPGTKAAIQKFLSLDMMLDQPSRAE